MARARVLSPDSSAVEWDSLASQVVERSLVLYLGAEIPNGKDYSEIEYRYAQNDPPAIIHAAMTNAVLADAQQWGYVLQKPDILLPALQQGV